jgi:predicted N-acetyltransferase YhbS
MKFRELSRDEIPNIWQIDRSEVIDNIYYLRNGQLVLEPEQYDMRGWLPGEIEKATSFLLDSFDHGGHFLGAFDGEQMVGVTVLESRFIGSAKDTLQMKFLHVSRAFRQHGLGKKLFWLTARKAMALGARKLYVSATPSENTVNFYLRLGCALATEIDEGLFQLEPEDIHLEFDLEKFRERIA